MALQKQVFRMSAQGGLDTKSDEKNVLATNFLELENVVFTKLGAFTKRYGYTPFTNAVLNSGTKISSGKAVTTFKEELIRYSNSNAYSYLESENRWIDRGATQVVQNSEVAITSNGDRLSWCSHDTYQNLSCYVYVREAATTTKVEYRILDNSTGASIYTGTIDNVNKPAVYAIQGKFFILYSGVSSNVISFRTINFSTPTEISAATTVFSANNWASNRIGNRLYVVGSVSPATGCNVAFIRYDTTMSSIVSVSDAAVFLRYSVSAEANTNVRLVLNSASNTKTILLSTDLNAQVHPMLTISSVPNAKRVVSIQDPSSLNKSQIYESSTYSTYSELKKYVVTSAGALESSSTPFYQATPISKPQIYNGKVYFAFMKDVYYYYTVSPAPFRTVYLGSEDGEILAKYNDDANARPEDNYTANLIVEGDRLSFTAVEAAEIQTNLAGNLIHVPTNVKKYTSDFSAVNNFFDATLGDNLHVAGGVLKMYDGERFVEHGFLEIPKAPTLVSSTTTGAVMTAGTYYYCTVYAWKDRFGQIHRSAPSLPMEYTIVDSRKPTIAVYTTAFTSKENVEIEVYRTENGGTTFYKRAHAFSDRIANDKTVQEKTFTDTVSDGQLTGADSNVAAEILYTTGGVLENTSAPSSKFVTSYKNRLFLVLSDGKTVQYSKKREFGKPVEFSDLLRINLDEFGGPGTSSAVMDDHLIIFKERAIFAMNGEGPNNLGEQDDFRQPYLVTSDCGCTEPSSIVVTPDGIMFKGEKGLYLLGRNLAVSYIGAPVEAYNGAVITSANLISDTNEVRFTTDTDKLLMYDYLQRKWSTFTNINAVDAVNFRNKYVYLRETGELLSETKGVYHDNGSYVSMKITSSWIQLADIQGFQRLYKLLLLGTYKNAHGLRVKFAYDFNPTFVHEAQVDAGELLERDPYGTETYGTETPYGSTFPLYQFRVFPKVQKCEAFKFSIVDYKTDSDGESLSISNFAAEVGIKSGAAKKGKSIAAS